MRLRITPDIGEGRWVVHVDGELVGEGPRELQKTCVPLGRPLALDLSGLDRIDHAGIEVLHALERSGACLQGMNPYIAMLVRGARTPASF